MNSRKSGVNGMQAARDTWVREGLNFDPVLSNHNKELITVTKGNHNLIRINFIPKSNLLDFVIILDNKFVIHYVGKDGKEQTYPVSNNIDNIHITYHSSRKNKNDIMMPELHLKAGKKTLNIFDKIIDINTNTEFPIPLFKITCNDVTLKNELLPTATKNNTIDLDDYGGGCLKEYNITEKNVNTAEIYLASKLYFEYPRHVEKWPGLGFLQMMSPIDYVISGVDLRADIVENFAEGNVVLAQEAQIHDQYVLLIKKYNDGTINDNSIYFYENINYIDMLATTPICLTTEDGEENRHYSLLYCSPFTAAYCDPFSGIFPAFCYDLDVQLQNNISFEKVNRWHSIFRNSLENIKMNNIKRKGFIIPQM